MYRALIEWFPVLAMPGFAFGFGFGPQGPRSTTQGTYTPPAATGDGTMNFSRLPANTAQSDALLALFEDI